jgi:glycerol-3-phosphate dehydrogenase (NAD(P)+)
LQEAFDHAEMIVLAVPAQTLRENLTQWKSYFSLEVPIVSTLKGIEVSTQLRMSEVIQEVLGISEKKIAILTGPNLAKEVVLRQPAGAVAASTSQELADLTAEVFSAPYFRVYTSNDVIGCELAGAAKNVIALAVGMSIGMGFGENTQSLVITRGLNELTKLGMARGAMPLTFVGLAGVGDLLATCGSPLSRNRSFGEALGRTGSMKSAQEEVLSTVEGVATARAVVDLAHLVGVEAPIMEAVQEVVSNNITPAQAITQLMKIHTGAEIDHV